MHKPANPNQEIDFIKYPICVDLDGTLWAGDCLWVCARKFLKRYPFRVPQLFLWWLQSRVHLKHNLLKYVTFDASELVYFAEVLRYLTDLKNRGAKLYLVTGSDQAIADQVSRHLNLFENAYGSIIGTNLVGYKKADMLNQLFGMKQYIYFGNEWKDRLVWQHSKAAGCVNIDNKTLKWLTFQQIYIRRFICK
jgi:phosphoserine phosphatase